MIGNSSGHRWRNSQRFVNPAEIVIHVVERNRGGMVTELFAECVGQTREAPHAHPHREILALNITG